MTITPRYGEALLWAEQIHRDQRRKGKPIPYISHLIGVSALVWEDGGTEDQAIAALLHDAIEDAGQSHASIAERFDSAVADIVLDCTDTNGTPVGGEKEPWLLRKTRYIASLEHKPEASLLVTAAQWFTAPGTSNRLVVHKVCPRGMVGRLSGVSDESRLVRPLRLDLALQPAHREKGAVP
ncbi:HD domain-containing protein [Synechococcus sp. CB0205]|uniref:HD domain-containing protein n=1 Tax=Synechococcus sp. CB0205 TaxID=232363 RepID=UPI001E30E8CC|nr:HD domain-containing protein [Synechococcus sp. CB0205]